MAIELTNLVKVAIATIRKTQLKIDNRLQRNPGWALKPAPSVKKPLLNIDLHAEDYARAELFDGLDLTEDGFEYFGEEILGVTEDAEKINLGANEYNKRLVALVDMIDGTDLLERGLSNWCSAMVFYEPGEQPGRKILAAFVGLPEDGVYYATRGGNAAWKHRFHLKPGERERDSELPPVSPQVDTVSNASICFYGQQIDHLAWLSPEDKICDSEKAGFIQHLKHLSAESKRTGKKLATRIYNLDGMPMMMKMLDSGNRLRRIDAVFNVCGQQPHDVVAGAFIACAAGAVLTDLDGKEVDLEESLLRPAKERLRYVLATNGQLAAELRSCLQAVPPLRQP